MEEACFALVVDVGRREELLILPELLVAGHFLDCLDGEAAFPVLKGSLELWTQRRSWWHSAV